MSYQVLSGLIRSCQLSTGLIWSHQMLPALVLWLVRFDQVPSGLMRAFVQLFVFIILVLLKHESVADVHSSLCDSSLIEVKDHMPQTHLSGEVGGTWHC